MDNRATKEMNSCSTGAKREKMQVEPYDLIPFQEIADSYARVANYGAEKYTSYWESLGYALVNLDGISSVFFTFDDSYDWYNIDGVETIVTSVGDGGVNVEVDFDLISDENQDGMISAINKYLEFCSLSTLPYSQIELELRSGESWTFWDFTGVDELIKDMSGVFFKEGIIPYRDILVKSSGAWNWTKGLPRVQILGSLLRHTFSYLRGEDIDCKSKGGSGLSHTDHILWNAVALVHSCKHGVLDDRRVEPIRDYS